MKHIVTRAFVPSPPLLFANSRLAPKLALACAAILTAIASCGGDDSPDSKALEPASEMGASGNTSDDPEIIAKRDLIAALFAEERYADALALLKPMIDVEEPALWDLVAAGICEKSNKKISGWEEMARVQFLRAYEIDSESPAVLYNLGQLAFYNNDLELALEYFKRGHELAPNDLPMELALSLVYTDLDQEEKALSHLRSLQAVGFEYSGSWYNTILYRLASLLYGQYQEDESAALRAERLALIDRGVPAPGLTDMERGNFGRILPPTPIANNGLQVAPLPSFGAATDFGMPANLVGIIPFALNENWVRATDDGDPATIGTTDWLAWGAGGVFARNSTGEVSTITTKPVQHLRGLDIEQLITKTSHFEGDGDGDFLATSGKDLWLFQVADGAWSERKVFEYSTAPLDITLTDFDHEGDLDVLAVGDFGVKLLRNDGAFTEAGGFVDITAEAGLDNMRALEWCLAEDLDTDQDVDFLVGGASGVHQADNLRGGIFQWEPERTKALPIGNVRPLVADRDGDARPDLFFGDKRCFLGRGDGSWQVRLEAPEGRPLSLLGDLDCNGDTDALALDPMGAPTVWSGLATSRPLSIATFDRVPNWGACADVDGDGAMDLVVLRDGKAALHLGTRPENAKSFRLALYGKKDNRRGVGAIVEVRTGPVYRRIFWRGEPATIGLSGRDEAEVVRITWPNGVVQSLVKSKAGVPLVVIQKDGLIGSCPFLYAWNGETYTFISDVLGITPLGLPMAPGMLVPPDHDEFVLVTGEQLVAREVDGGSYYDFQFTEELREVTYLDKVRLDIVDHPAGSEIFPDERFTFPPFPAEHTHMTIAPKGPLRAMQVTYTKDAPAGTLDLGEHKSERDWATELAAIDGDYAAPFTHYQGRFQGLTPLHALELTFDKEQVAAGGELRLFMTGWFFWTNASVNMATARTPGIEFMPPVLQVPDGSGGWRDLGPPVGFPAGKTKTMVIDIAGQLDPADPRMRVVSTLRLYWDSIRLGLDENAANDAPMIVTSIDLDSANLWERGFSRPIPMEGMNGLEWFQWDELESDPRWNQHPGMYTKHGDVDELLHVSDDMFVILGSGDSLQLRFDASLAPPLRKGYRRDYLLYLDGWAKDRDPNSIEAKFVEPLPFHGMSGYPYGESEHFPNTEEHRAWRIKWNTRDAKQWIQPLGNL